MYLWANFHVIIQTHLRWELHHMTQGNSLRRKCNSKLRAASGNDRLPCFLLAWVTWMVYLTRINTSGVISFLWYQSDVHHCLVIHNRLVIPGTYIPPDSRHRWLYLVHTYHQIADTRGYIWYIHTTRYRTHVVISWLSAIKTQTLYRNCFLTK